jgi:hypothetical protein
MDGHLSHYGSTALCWALAAFSVSWSFYTVDGTPWKGDQLIARPLPTHRTTQTQNKRTQYRHSCLELDSNPRSQCLREQRQFIRQTARPVWSAGGWLSRCIYRELARWIRRWIVGIYRMPNGCTAGWTDRLISRLTALQQMQATLPSHTWRWPVMSKHVVRYNEESAFQ